MTPIRSCIAESTDNRPRDLCWCNSLGMFLVSFLYERRCLRIDLLKINCCLYVPFNIWFLCVESITFVLRNTQRNDSEGIFYLLISSWNLCHSVMGSCLCLFLRCSFRIIFVLIRYVATIAMIAFYDEALRIAAFKHCYDFQPASKDLATVFMQSVHRAGQPHGMACSIIARI